MAFRIERLKDRWQWCRIADPFWTDPLDPGFARQAGGRWNPPESFDTLYLNEDTVSARLNLRAFIATWPYEPEDLRADNGPVLVFATLPRNQRVADIHTPDGVRDAGLPCTYPFDHQAGLIPHSRRQPIGAAVKDANLRGVRSRSAQSRDGVGLELAWFPTNVNSRALVTC